MKLRELKDVYFNQDIYIVGAGPSVNLFPIMRAKELTGKVTRLMGNPEDSETLHARKGKVGGFTDYVEGEDLDFLNCKLRDLSRYFGYGT